MFLMSELAPQRVTELSDLLCRRVEDAFEVRPDMTHDTLPLVDAFLRAVVRDAEPEERDDLLAAAGIYFGEVCRELLAARWSIDDEHDYLGYRLELSSCYLYFYPVGMAGEVLMGCEAEQYDGNFGTHDDLHEPLQQMLQNMAPMSETDYYSLTGRVDVLQHVADFLTGKRIVDGKGKRPQPIGAEEYRQLLAARHPS
jgi:hypothetical protein